MISLSLFHNFSFTSLFLFFILSVYFSLSPFCARSYTCVSTLFYSCFVLQPLHLCFFFIYSRVLNLFFIIFINLRGAFDFFLSAVFIDSRMRRHFRDSLCLSIACLKKKIHISLLSHAYSPLCRLFILLSRGNKKTKNPLLYDWNH